MTNEQLNEWAALQAKDTGELAREIVRLRMALKDARPYLVAAAHFQADVRANDIIFEIDAALKDKP